MDQINLSNIKIFTDFNISFHGLLFFLIFSSYESHVHVTEQLRAYLFLKND